MTEQHVALFAVVQDGHVLALQDNFPVLSNLENSQVPGSYLISTEEFTGQPTFWLEQGSSEGPKLNFSGIAPKDWEHGVEGKATLAVPSLDGDSIDEFIVHIEIRSIDTKDITFYRREESATVEFCTQPSTPVGVVGNSVAAPVYRYKVEIVADEIAISSEYLTQTNCTSDFKVGVDYTTGEDMEVSDELVSLTLTREYGWRNRSSGNVSISSNSARTSVSKLKMHLSTRPLLCSDSYDNNGKLIWTSMPLYDPNTSVAAIPPIKSYKTDAPKFKIEGDSISTAGFEWEISPPSNQGGVDGLKLEPTFKEIGPGNEAVLELVDESQWDWYYGSEAYTTITLKDGHRPPVEIPVRFVLHRDDTPMVLYAGTKLSGPDGEAFEISEDMEVTPIIEGNDILLKDINIISTSSGAEANLPQDSVLTFDEKLPLIGPATVTEEGLNGGDDLESDEELRTRVQVQWAYPPGHSNRSQLLKVAEQTEGVDRAFIYPPFGMAEENPNDGLGRTGIAIVAPAARPAVGPESPLAKEVIAKIDETCAFTGDYFIMDVLSPDQYVESPPTGHRVDVEIQLAYDDTYEWDVVGDQNLVIKTYNPGEQVATIWRYSGTDLSGDEQETNAHIDQALTALNAGDVLYFEGKPYSISYIDEEQIKFDSALLTADGTIASADYAKRRAIYPQCPTDVKVEEAVRKVFEDLGTSETKIPEDPDLMWHRRFPSIDFVHPAKLRIAEIYNQVMDIPGIKDMRMITPTKNVEPQHNEKIGDAYITYILSLRHLSIGPFRKTAGLDFAESDAEFDQ